MFRWRFLVGEPLTCVIIRHLNSTWPVRSAPPESSLRFAWIDDLLGNRPLLDLLIQRPNGRVRIPRFPER